MEAEPLNRQLSLNSRSQGEWLQIQRNTFTNWVNEGLRPRGVKVDELMTDFSDGVKLVALVESLTRHTIAGAVTKPTNQYQKLQNVTFALDAVRRDGVKIVNIDSSDILERNLKLILGLVWQLILKYQIGLGGAQQKTWILKWLNAVIPECRIKNFTTDWNDGTALHALLDFCKPGLSPNWRNLDKSDKLGNCQTAMTLAMQNFNIPLVLRPDDLASPQLDEKSAITYLSYFIKVGGPGYDATLQRVSSRALPKVVSNFTTDWRDGQALVNLVRSAGGHVTHGSDGQASPLELINQALEAGQALGVEPLLLAEEIASETTEHVGIMAYGAQYLRYPNVTTYNTSEHEKVVYINRRSDKLIPNGHVSVSHSNLNDINHYNHDDIYNHNNNIKNAGMKPLKVTTFQDDDEIISSHASIIASPVPAAPASRTFHLVRKSSFHAPRIEAPTLEQLKVDIYSVGVIMESKMTGSFDPEKFKVEAVAPSGRIIRINGDGHYAAQFNADEIGRWKVSMYYENRFLDGCPIDVCDPSQVKVLDLQGGLVGKSNTFHVDCTKAGPGDLGVDVKHKGKPVVTNITPTSTPGYYKVTFTPYEPGAFEINVHFNRAEVREGAVEFFDPAERQRKAVFYTRVEPQRGYVEVKASCDWEVDYITGIPFICHVTDSSDIAVYGMQDGTVCAHPEMIADCTRVGEGRIEADVTYQGMRYPCKVKKDKPSIYKVSFKPRGPGTYKVWINYDGRPVKGSPFIQEILELEKPSATGDGLYRGVPNKPATFTVDPRGFPGQVYVAVDGPSRPVKSELEPQPDGTIKATYHPTERGPHTIDVKLDGKPIDGSPYKPLIVDPVNVRVSGGWRPYLDDKGVIPLRVNKEKHLPFDVTEAGPGELTAEVQGPNGKIPVAIDARNDGKHSVIFTPREEGKHHIHVNWGGYPLSNSPYLGYATHEPELDQPDFARVLHVPVAYPDRYHSPRSSVVGSAEDPPASIVLSEPENYKPTHAYYQPNQPETVYYQPNQPSTRVQVLPSQKAAPPREPTRIYVDEPPVPKNIVYEPPPRTYFEPRLRDAPPSNRPLSSRASTASQTNSPPTPKKVILSGKGLKEAEVGKPANFKVDGIQATPGRPTARLEGVKDNIPVTSEPMVPQVYKCTYVPKTPGAYLLYINWNDQPLKGSPFKVNIREPAKPDKVTTYKPGQSAYMGKDLEMKIDPREAGPGQLTVSATDPIGEVAPCRLADNFDGTKTLKITPKRAGRHIVEIRYDGQHIMGSPYAIDIKEQPITGTVKVWGPGIENGIIPSFQSTFWVETTGAGAGDLRVRIMGPKGAFHVKMRKASQKDKIYQCFYDPVEPGIYTVNVEWSGQHVGGSPFTVLLATTARELMLLKGEVGENLSAVNGDETESVLMRRNQGMSLRPGEGIGHGHSEILY